MIEFIVKQWPTLLVFIAGILASTGLYFQTLRNDKIQELLDIRTAHEAAENLSTGELNLHFTPTFSQGDEFFLELGTGMAVPTKTILEGQVFKRFIPDLKFEPIKIEIKDQQLVLSLKIFDPDGNLIAEVKNNNWRPYRNFYGVFNYDSSGFEVKDNQGNIAVSIDVKTNNRVAIQGVFRSRFKKTMVIAAGKELKFFPFLDREGELDYDSKHQISYNETIDTLVNLINPLFEYFGPDWLHKRVTQPEKVLTNSFFNPDAHPMIRPNADFMIPFVNVTVSYQGKQYRCNVSSVDHMKPERVLFRVENWKDKKGLSQMMLEKTAGSNHDQWTNSRPLDIHDPAFIDASIKVLKNLLSNNHYPNKVGEVISQPKGT